MSLASAMMRGVPRVVGLRAALGIEGRGEPVEALARLVRRSAEPLGDEAPQRVEKGPAAHQMRTRTDQKRLQVMVAPIGLADVVRRGQEVDEDVGRPVGERHVDLAKVAVEAVSEPPHGLRQRLAAGELVRVGGFALMDLDQILGVPERPQHVRIERLEEALEDRLRDVALFLVADGRVELLPDLAEEGLVVVEGELAEVFEEGAAGLRLLHRHVAGRALVAETAQTGTERLVEAQPVAAQHLARELRAEIVDDLPMRIGDGREPDGGDAVVGALAGSGKNLPRIVDGDAFRFGADRREQQRERRLLGNAPVGVDAAPEIAALHVLIVDDGQREERHVARLQLAAGRELEGEIVSPARSVARMLTAWNSLKLA